MISVIIPTYNEEEVIIDCLSSLSKQTFKDFEVIAVDDGSTDSTLKQVKNFKARDFNLKVIQGKHEGPGPSRNLGAKSANGDILVFLDSDMTFDKDFLKNLIKPIISKNSKGTNSLDEFVSNWGNPLSRAYSLNEGWLGKKRHSKEDIGNQKVFRAILRKEFEKVGGFTAGGYNDDWSLSEKLGYEATIAGNAIFFHKNPDSLHEIYNHAKWVGKREYKFGFFGFVIALLRSSLPVSVIVGLFKTFIYSAPMFLIFKVVYDFGIFVGILNYIFTKEGSK